MLREAVETHPKFYIPTPADEAQVPTIHPTLESKPGQKQKGPVVKLYNQSLEVFTRNPSTDGVRKFDESDSFDNKLKLYTAENAYSPTGREGGEQFETQLKEVISRYTSDLVDEQGNPIKGKEQEFNNLVEIAPKLLACLSDRENLVSQVHESHALNLVQIALHKARYPDAELLIRTGIGGSDDPFTSHRFAAYALPALRMADTINTVYEQRKRDVLRRTARARAIAEYEAKNGIITDKAQKTTIANTAEPDELGHYAAIPIDEETDILKQYGVATTPARVQFVFTPHAATAINHSKEPKAIRIRTDENKAAIATLVTENFPEIAHLVTVTEDIPWNSDTPEKRALKPYAKVVVNYLADLLRRTDDPAVRKALDQLEGMGRNHGGNNGAAQAYEYAASHPLVFGDRIRVPFAHFIQDHGERPDLLVTIGGRPERLFNMVREYLSREADVHGLQTYILQKIDQSQDDHEIAQLTHIQQLIQRWEKTVKERRAEYAPERRTSVLQPDKPEVSAFLISPIGETPTYFATEFDKPIDTDFNTQLAEAQAVHTTLNEQRKTGSHNGHTKEINDRHITASAVVFDLQALRNASPRRSLSSNGVNN